VQAGVLEDKRDALRLFERLKALGMRPSISPMESGGGTRYRIRVGRFPDRSGAEQQVDALAAAASVAPEVVQP
jgi:cell division septation protein DedD